ncbi:MAG TPA: glycosyl hydrolase [Bacteroidota bacterium]
MSQGVNAILSCARRHLGKAPRRASTRLFGLATFLLAAVSWSQVPVPATGCYHAAFTPNDPAHGAYGHDEFVTLAHKPIAIEMFYTGWPSNKTPDFPFTVCDTIVKKGSYPHVTWEPWTGGNPYGLDPIINGWWDAYLTGYANQVKFWAKPLFIRVGHEMNGDWYPWGGKNNGGGTLNGFGDSTKPDGPERFVAAFRHIRHIFDSAGVTNVSWIWSPNNFSSSGDAWNTPERYYPGDDVVDWIGLDGYNWGTSQTWSGWSSFYSTFSDCYNRFSSYGKPMMIAEFASTELGGDKSQWIRDVFLYTKGLFPKIKALTWFNTNKETDWRINSTVAAAVAYQQSVADDYFLGGVATTVVHASRPESGRLALLSPVPNPSNGGIRFSFLLPRSMKSTLRVYNLLGQEVRRVGEGVFGQGLHFWYWDGRDDRGCELSSGMYLAILDTEQKRLSQKILLTK